MDICARLFCICVVLCVGSGLAAGLSPVQGVLPTVYKIKKLKKRPRSNKRTVESQSDRLLYREIIGEVKGKKKGKVVPVLN
jgi:hypothetical protein